MLSFKSALNIVLRVSKNKCCFDEHIIKQYFLRNTENTIAEFLDLLITVTSNYVIRTRVVPDMNAKLPMCYVLSCIEKYIYSNEASISQILYST